MKLFDFLRRPKKLSNDQMAIVALDQKIEALQTHLIALARLSLIKPQRFVEESENVNGNGEYLLKMIEFKEKGKTK